MLQGQLKEFSFWMVCLQSVPFEPKMFGSKTCGHSTFYTDLHITDEKDSSSTTSIDSDEKSVNRNSRLLEQQSVTSEDGNSQDSDSVGGQDDQHNQYPRHSFHTIASFGGFHRFRSFVMSASSTATCSEVIGGKTTTTQETSTTESSFSNMSRSVLEYRSSR